jgi:radical SAM protein with 4Fe4S-binding SPASM domain
VYHRLAESKGFTPTEAGFFIGIKETKIDQIFYAPPDAGGGDDKKKPSFTTTEILEDFDYKVGRYVSEVLNADFEKSAGEKYGVCLRCDYRRLCRSTCTVQRETRMGRKRR